MNRRLMILGVALTSAVCTADDRTSADWTLTVDCNSPIRVLDWPIRARPVAVVSNALQRVQELSGRLRVQDFFSRGFTIPVAAVLEPGASVEIPIPAGEKGVSAKGVWTVSAELSEKGGGKSVVREDRFAVLDRHPTGQRVPYGTFRAGTHTHLFRYPPEQRRLILDAIARMGAGIVRLDVAFEARNMDRLAEDALGELERRGLAVMALMYPLEWWGLQPEKEIEYAEKLARLCGNRVDYLEVGNEFDFCPSNKLTVAQAVAAQKRAYSAIKRICPKARVSTNGFAMEDSNAHSSIVQKGFQETFLRDAKGFYDVHAVHIHTVFDEFATRIDRFLAMRRENGVDEVPWLAGETALRYPCYGDVFLAKTVWQKILFAWSRGATDYIWYDLPSKNYGMYDPDMRPRLQYAAFSGLAACVAGGVMEGEIFARQGRRVYRVRKTDGMVLAGWDSAVFEPADVRVRTDAHRVWQADVVNNRQELRLADGIAVWKLGDSPGALVCEGASFVEPDASDLARVAVRPPKTIRVRRNSREKDAWDAVMKDPVNVHENYIANPDAAHRYWKGTEDLSARMMFYCDPDPELRLIVLDEKDTPGDRVEIWIDGTNATSRLTISKTREKVMWTGPSADKIDRSVYTIGFPTDRPFRFNVRIRDDDGYGGEDGWMDYVPFDAGNPDPSSWTMVRFE